jgi:hypothetical protein
VKKKSSKDDITRELTAEDPAGGILEELLSSPSPGGRSTGLIIGRLCGRDETGAPLVDFADNPSAGPLPARSTVMLGDAVADREVALLFEDNQRRRPVIVGVIQPAEQVATAMVDGREVVLEGKERVELRCGKAKIVLTKDGKVLVKGTDILSRSEGPNRLKGASIQLN